MNINYINRGKGFWKFNTSLLLDDKYKTLIKQTISEFLNFNGNCYDPRILWDTLKCVLRGVTIKYSAHIAAIRNRREKYLCEKIKLLTESNITNINVTNELKECQREYDLMHLHRTEAAMLRSKCRWTEKGERCTKFFLNLEKRNYNNKAIRKLTINGNETLDQNLIMNELTDHFKKLYQKQFVSFSDEELSNYIKNSNAPTLSQQNSMSCEGKLTLSECFKSLCEMANNKSPGLDGFVKEFYVAFWDEIKYPLINALNYGFEQKELAESQRLAVIVLVPKANKDITQVDSYRPISLLGVDYKIASKSINKRIQKVLHSIIDRSQNGFMSNRFIGDNIRLLFNIIDYCDNSDIKGVLLAIDFAKAFDSVNWSFIQGVLRYLGFGPDVLQWVKTFYYRPRSVVTNNGYISEPFNIEKGVRQGDALSASLFLIAIEILACTVRESPKISGLRLNDETEFRISLLADDAILFLNLDTPNVFDEALKLLDEFGTYSGCIVNRSKCNGVLVGGARGGSISNTGLNIILNT